MSNELTPESGAVAEHRQDVDATAQKIAAIKNLYGDDACKHLIRRMKAGELGGFEFFNLLLEGDPDAFVRELKLSVLAQAIKQMSVKEFRQNLFIAWFFLHLAKRM